MKRAHFLVEAFSWAGWWRKRICLGHVWRCVSTEHSTTQLDHGTRGTQVVPIATPKNVIDSSRESKKLSTSTLINTAALEVLKPHQLRANPETSLSCIPRKPSKSFFRYPPFLVFLFPKAQVRCITVMLLPRVALVGSCIPSFSTTSVFFETWPTKTGNLNPDYQLQLTADFEYIQAPLVGGGMGFSLGDAMRSRLCFLLVKVGVYVQDSETNNTNIDNDDEL